MKPLSVIHIQTENAYSSNNLSINQLVNRKKISCQLFLLIHSVIFKAKLQENMSWFNPLRKVRTHCFTLSFMTVNKMSLDFTLKMSYLRDITLGSGQL